MTRVFGIEGLAIRGSIVGELYWIEGMADWVDMSRYAERPAKKGETIYLAVGWVNGSEVAITGHIDLSLVSPSGVEHSLSATLNQDKAAEPNNGWWVQFEPFVLDEAGSWTLKAVLSSEGVVLSENHRSLDVSGVAVPLWAFGLVILAIIGGGAGVYYSLKGGGR